MLKSILKASAIALLLTSISLTSCEAIKNCCGEESCSSATMDSTTTVTTDCSKCGKTACDKTCSTNPSP